MRRALLLSLVVLAAAAIPAGARGAPCTMPGARTVAHDAQARVFTVAGRGPVRRRYYGCLRGHRPRLLARAVSPRSDQDTHTTIGLVRLTGAWVGWHVRSVSDFGAGELAESLEVRSLAGARRSLSIAVTGRPVRRFVLRADGTAAWVLAIGDYREIDAVAHDTTTPSPIAYARGISSGSVRVARSSVSWTQGATAMTAPLAAPAPPPTGRGLGPQAMDGRFGDCGTLVPAPLAGHRSVAASQLAPAPDGSIVAAGAETSGAGGSTDQDTFVVARLTRAGRLDGSFGQGGVVSLSVPRAADAQDAVLSDALVQPDGKVVLVGYVRQNDPRLTRAIAYRLDADGTPDRTFGADGVVVDPLGAQRSSDIRAVALAPGGGLLVAGQRDERFSLARLTADGALDQAFGDHGLAVDPGRDPSAAAAISVASDGTIFAGGQAASAPMLVRFDATGAPQSGAYAGPPAAASIVALAPRPGGGVIALGTASNVVAGDQLFLGRYTAAGAPDTSFGAHGFVLDPQVSAPRGLAVGADGAITATASFDLQPGGYAGSGLVRYTAGGVREAGFGLRGALGGVSSYGLVNGDVLLDEAGGTAYTAQQNGLAFAVTRFAVGGPATGAVAGEPAVCALATGPHLGPLVHARRLGVSLRLRAPGPLRIGATARVGGATITLGHASLVARYIEGAVATIRVSPAAARRLARLRSVRVTLTARAPGGAPTTFTRILTR